jgi:hypothetical protein
LCGDDDDDFCERTTNDDGEAKILERREDRAERATERERATTEREEGMIRFLDDSRDNKNTTLYLYRSY